MAITSTRGVGPVARERRHAYREAAGEDGASEDHPQDGNERAGGHDGDDDVAVTLSAEARARLAADADAADAPDDQTAMKPVGRRRLDTTL